MGAGDWLQWAGTLEQGGVELVATENIIDMVWTVDTGRPPALFKVTGRASNEGSRIFHNHGEGNLKALSSRCLKPGEGPCNIGALSVIVKSSLTLV